jgi:hypothetical protein
MKTQIKSITACIALLVSGAAMIPQSAEARPPRARELCGVIQAIDPQTRTLTIQSPKSESAATFAVKGDTRFIKDWKFTTDTALKAGLRACVYYRSPFFGKPFITKVVWISQQNPG